VARDFYFLSSPRLKPLGISHVEAPLIYIEGFCMDYPKRAVLPGVEIVR
jgi:hypothetical protein